MQALLDGVIANQIAKQEHQHAVQGQMQMQAQAQHTNVSDTDFSQGRVLIIWSVKCGAWLPCPRTSVCRACRASLGPSCYTSLPTSAAAGPFFLGASGWGPSRAKDRFLAIAKQGHQPIPPFQCMMCDQYLTSQDSYRSHLRGSHRDLFVYDWPVPSSILKTR